MSLFPIFRKFNNTPKQSSINGAKRLALAVSFLFIAFVTPGMANDSAFNQYIGFGDSTLDSGYFRFHLWGIPALDQQVRNAIANGASGAFVGPGVVNSLILAGKFDLFGGPIGSGGTNYAIGDSNAATNTGPTKNVLPATQQIRNYLASVNGVANPNALYVVKTGDNDATFVGTHAAWFKAHPNYLNAQCILLAQGVASLQAAGARTILVPSSYDRALFASLGGDIPAVNASAYELSHSFANERWVCMAFAGVRFIPADFDSLFRFIVKNPERFGFVPSSVLATSPASSTSALLTTWADVTPLKMRTYLFLDGKHLTTAGQTIEADYEYSLLAAPGQISLIAENDVQIGLARIDTIRRQIDFSGQHRAPGSWNTWITGATDHLKLKNSSNLPDASGNPFGGSVGVDYQFPCGVLLGAAFTAGHQSQTFTENAGDYDQDNQAFSLYTAYKAGPVWADAVANYGISQDKLSRPVQLGLYTDQNNGKTTGDSPALALRIGGDMKFGRITTGPVAGIVMQQVNVDGFTETGGITALRFDSQTRNSYVTGLGWRVSADLGKWQPFGEARWNHELANKDRRTVQTSLTSTSAPSYSLAAAELATDWATVSIGTSYKLTEKVSLQVTALATFFSPQVVTYGGEFGVSFGF